VRTERGRVLRDTSMGDGLLSAGGNQYPFRLEGIWKSEHAPRVNMQVEIDFDDSGAIGAVRAADPMAQAREQAARFAASAAATAKTVGAEIRSRGGPALARALPIVQRCSALVGVPTLVSLAALGLGWFAFAAASIDFFGQHQSATFYGLMRILNNPDNGMESVANGTSAGAGIYGFVTFLALLAPLVPYIAKKRQLWLACCAPLGWMVLATLIGWWKVHSSVAEAAGAASSFGGEDVGDLTRGMARDLIGQIFDAISFGFGLYLAAAAAIYLGFVGVRRFLGTRPA
jgi:hypothetical protein